MAYSWNTKPNTSTKPNSYSWSTPEGRQLVEQRASFVRNNPQKSLTQRLISGVTDTVKSVFKEKEKVDLTMTGGVIKPAYKVWSDTIVDTGKRFNAAMDAYTKPGPNDKANVAIKTAQAGLGGVNVFFAPITGVMKGLESNPIVGYLATTVNALFAGIGTGSSIVAVDQLEKSNLSRETKDKLNPLVSEVAALVGMLAAGKGGTAVYGKIKTNTNTILDTVKTEGKSEMTRAVSEAKTSPAQTEVQAPRTTYSWSREEGKPTDYTTFRSETNLKLQQEAQSRGIVFDADIPVQTRMSMIENLKKAEEIVKTDPIKAERFLTREEPLPSGVEIGSIYKALKEKALADGDAGLVERLSRTTVGTESARALKSFDEGVKLNADPVEALAEVRQARLSAAVGREKGITIEKAVKETRAQVGKILRPDRATWDDFIKSLEC